MLERNPSLLISRVGRHVYNICNSCQCFLYPCGQLTTLLPSSTDVRIISSSRKRIYRESLAEVRLGFFSLPGASSKLCLLWKLKPEFWAAAEAVCTRVVKNIDARFKWFLFIGALHNDNCSSKKTVK